MVVRLPVLAGFLFESNLFKQKAAHSSDNITVSVFLFPGWVRAVCLHLFLEERDSLALWMVCLVSPAPYSLNLLRVPDCLEAAHSWAVRHFPQEAEPWCPPDHTGLQPGHSFLELLDPMPSASTVASTWIPFLPFE